MSNPCLKKSAIFCLCQWHHFFLTHKQYPAVWHELLKRNWHFYKLSILLSAKIQFHGRTHVRGFLKSTEHVAMDNGFCWPPIEPAANGKGLLSRSLLGNSRPLLTKWVIGKGHWEKFYVLNCLFLPGWALDLCAFALSKFSDKHLSTGKIHTISLMVVSVRASWGYIPSWNGMEWIHTFVFLSLSFSFSLSLYLVLSLKFTVSSQCPGGDWSHFQSNCYYIDTRNASWSEASVLCQQNNAGSTLVDIYSDGENDYVTSLGISKVGNSSFWIGYNDISSEGHFVWTRTGQAGHYTKWLTGQPDSAYTNDDCAELLSNPYGRWNDRLCQNKIPFICKKPGQHCISAICVLFFPVIGIFLSFSKTVNEHVLRNSG